MTSLACLKTLAAMAGIRIINCYARRSTRKIETIRSVANQAWLVILIIKMIYQFCTTQLNQLVSEETTRRAIGAKWAWECRKSARSLLTLARRSVKACSLSLWPAQPCNTSPWSSSFQLFATCNTQVSRVMRLASSWRLPQPVNLSQAASLSLASASLARNGQSSWAICSWSYQVSPSGWHNTTRMTQTSWQWLSYSDSRLVLAPASFAQWSPSHALKARKAIRRCRFKTTLSGICKPRRLAIS